MSLFDVDIAIDIGTVNTVISSNNKVVFRDASAVAVNAADGKPMAFGNVAEKMVGKTNKKIKAERPIVRGLIADYELTRIMLRHFFKSVCKNQVLKPRVMISIPAGVTAIQKRTFHKLITDSGARKVCMIESPIAAAIGAGVDFSTPHGSVIVDIGAGTTDVAVLTMGGLSTWDTLQVASCDIDEAIIEYVKKQYKINIGNQTAENIKLKIAGASEREIEIAMTATGTSIFSGIPQSFEITSKELVPVVRAQIDIILAGIKGVLERTDPELLGDIYSDGFIFSGGGSQLFGLREYVEQSLSTKVRIVKSPEDCVSKGASIALKNLAILKNCDYRFQTLKDLTIDYDKNAANSEEY